MVWFRPSGHSDLPFYPVGEKGFAFRHSSKNAMHAPENEKPNEGFVYPRGLEIRKHEQCRGYQE
jgi:hypothetical protein